MKWFSGLLVGAMLVCAVPMAHADNFQVYTQGSLTQAQTAQLQAEAAKMAAANAANSNPQSRAAAPTDTAKRVEEWVNIGTAIGSGLAASAKQLGIAANQFATTPVGKITIFLIAWHFLGNTILHVVSSLIWFLTWIPVLIWYYKTNGFVLEKTVYEKGAGPNGVSKVINRTPKQMTEGKAAMGVIMFLVAVFGCCILFFA
jgi:hypothetical protein